MNDNYPELAVKPTFLQDAETPSNGLRRNWLMVDLEGRRLL